MKKLLIFILLFSQISLAQDAVFLEIGQLTPFEGFLLPKEKILELRNVDIDFQYLKKENVNLKTIGEDYEKRLNLYIEQNDKLSKRLVESDSSFIEKTAFFLFGAVLTGGIAFGIYRTK